LAGGLCASSNAWFGRRISTAHVPHRRDPVYHLATAAPKFGEPMNLVDLILLACTLSSPATCHEYHLLLETAGSLKGCTMQAQPYLAQWIGEHPNYRVARWHCAWPDGEQKKI
jgi:hypothetical protein